MPLRIGPPKHAGVSTNAPGAVFGPRHLRDFEFVWMQHGHAVYHHDDGRERRRIDAPPGTVVLCRPPATDAFDWDRKRSSQHAFVHFDVHDVPDHWPPPMHWPLARRIDTHDIIGPLFEHLLTWLEPTDGQADASREAVELTLMQLVTVFVLDRTRLTPVPPAYLPEPVVAATRYIHEQLELDPTRPISLDELGEAACVSPTHLCRLFAQSLGHSPVASVRLARLDRAYTMLCRSNEPIKRIAAACGFSSPFHFSRRFKEAYELSPSALRERARAGEHIPLPRLHGALRRIPGHPTR